MFRKERTYGTLEVSLQMPRKVVKVYLTPKQKQLLEWICRGLDTDESVVLCQAFMEYAKSISLITEAIHGKT